MALPSDPPGYAAVVDASVSTRAFLDVWQTRLRDARPFLKWAGGKHLLTVQHPELFPSFEGKYIEPFLGSAAVYFYVARSASRPITARLGDINRSLIRCFFAVRDAPEELNDKLDVLQAGYEAAQDRAAFYYDIRTAYNASLPKADAAKFVFLNQTCWNGLYRVNRDGHFNVPYGSPKTLRVTPSLQDLLGASAALATAELRATHWMNTVGFARPGDFLFLDPPYFSDLNTDDARYSPSKYSVRYFTARDHVRLAQTLRELAGRGIDFLLTNSGEQKMIDLYRDHGLYVERVRRPRLINSVSERRGVGAPEIIVGPKPF